MKTALMAEVVCGFLGKYLGMYRNTRFPVDGSFDFSSSIVPFFCINLCEKRLPDVVKKVMPNYFFRNPAWMKFVL